MLARSLDLLTQPFRSSIVRLLARCADQGVIMRPFFTLRTPAQQARLWRQSRSTSQVLAGIVELRAAGAPWLASVLESVGPQHGKHVTNALPGASWHQFGQAVDCYWEVKNGAAEWSAKVGGQANGYRVYASVAVELGLTPGGHWRSFRDWPHVQEFGASPPTALGWPEIDRCLRDRFLRNGA